MLKSIIHQYIALFNAICHQYDSNSMNYMNLRLRRTPLPSATPIAPLKKVNYDQRSFNYDLWKIIFDFIHPSLIHLMIPFRSIKSMNSNPHLPLDLVISWNDFAKFDQFKKVLLSFNFRSTLLSKVALHGNYSTMQWFQNTIFVITADHTSEAWQPFYKNRVGQYFIPIIFYEPQNGKLGHQGIVAQQTDIMPTILDMLHYPKPFVAFGGSLLRKSEPRFNLSYLNGNYQLIEDGYSWQTDHTISNALYNFEQDSLLTNELYLQKKNIAAQRDKLLKAVIQQYNNRLIENKLSIK